MPEDLDSWRDQNGQATTVAFTPSTYLVLPFCVCMQHAFGFMGASGRKSDLLKTKKKQKEENKMKRTVTRWKKNCSRGQRAGRVAMRVATVIQLQLRHRR